MVYRTRSQGVFAPVPARAPGAVELARQIHVAYRQYGYRLAESAQYLRACYDGKSPFEAGGVGGCVIARPVSFTHATYFVKTAGEDLRITRWFRHQ